MLARTDFLTVVCLLAATASHAQPTSATFGRVPAQVGDEAQQSLRVELRLKARVRRGADVLKESEANKVRAHDRTVTTIEVAAGRRTGVKVVYGEATDEAIAGKTYLCRRVGESLRIEDEQGTIPMPAEFEIVARHMEMLGKANPLAAFLSGKRVAVGETIDVPVEVAVALFGPEQFGGTDRFRLKLTGVDDSHGVPLARFAADLRVVATDGTQTRIEIGGPIVVEVASGRVASLELFGPIAMSQSRHDPDGLLQVSATGRLTVSMESSFRASRVALRPSNGWLNRY